MAQKGLMQHLREKYPLTEHNLLRLIRWAARIWSVSILLYVASKGIDTLVLVGMILTDGVYDLASLMLLAILIACVGLAVAWWWELAGGLTAIVAALVYQALEVAMLRVFVPNWSIILVLLPGLLYVLSWRLERLTAQSTTSGGAAG